MAWEGAAFAEAEIYRVVEALGVVAEAEIKADMTVPEAAPATPAGDTLLIGMDGTTSFIDGDWHEVKVGVVGLDVGTGEVPAGQRSIGTVATEGNQQPGNHSASSRIISVTRSRWVWPAASSRSNVAHGPSVMNADSPSIVESPDAARGVNTPEIHEQAPMVLQQRTETSSASIRLRDRHQPARRHGADHPPRPVVEGTTLKQ